MAKKINMKPQKGTINPQLDANYIKRLIDMFRKAINGDKTAKGGALFMLDILESGLNGKNTFPDLNSKNLFSGNGNLNDVDEDDLDDDNLDDDWDDDGLFEENFPETMMVTLPRKTVKEYHIRIKLNDTKLKIWREVKVPSNITVEALLRLLLLTMGWYLEHLFDLRYKNITYCSKKEMNKSIFGEDVDYSTVTISDLTEETGKRMKLEYDYGDSWHHDVWVKGIRDYDKDEQPKICFVNGEGACPPENCGGIYGYEELLKLRDKKRLTKDEREELDWFGMLPKDDFDPNEFDPDDAESYADELNVLLLEQTTTSKKTKK